MNGLVSVCCGPEVGHADRWRCRSDRSTRTILSLLFLPLLGGLMLKRVDPSCILITSASSLSSSFSEEQNISPGIISETRVLLFSTQRTDQVEAGGRSGAALLTERMQDHGGGERQVASSLPHSAKTNLSLSPSGMGRAGSGGGSPTSKTSYCGGVPVEDMQALAITSLSAADVAKQYEHIRELGKGTYGKVDLVAHRTQGTKIALKFVTKNKTKLKSFLREYSLTGSLSCSPFIIKVLDVLFETEDSYVFGQEYAPAGDLFDIIPPQVGLPEEMVKRCMQQLGLALDFMHSKSLVHRDVKPENVLLFDRECRRIKLADFGMTRRVGCRVKRVSGTIPYTAPEVCRANRSEGFLVTTSLDVWAFGVLVFCMLTGNFPWEAALPTDAFYEEFRRWQKAGCPVGTYPSQWRRFTDDALRMFQRLLAAEPEKRCGVKDVFCFIKYELVNELRRRASYRAKRGERSSSGVCTGSCTASLSSRSSHRHPDASTPPGTSCLRPAPLKRSVLSDPLSPREESGQHQSPGRDKNKSQMVMATAIEICV